MPPCARNMEFFVVLVPSHDFPNTIIREWLHRGQLSYAQTAQLLKEQTEAAERAEKADEATGMTVATGLPAAGVGASNAATLGKINKQGVKETYGKEQRERKGRLTIFKFYF